MKLKLDNLIYTTDDAVKIARLKEMGAVEVTTTAKTTKTTKTTTKAEKDA